MRAATWSPDGRFLVLGFTSRDMLIYDTEVFYSRAVDRVDRVRDPRLAFTADGQDLIAVTRNGEVIRISATLAMASTQERVGGGTRPLAGGAGAGWRRGGLGSVPNPALGFSAAVELAIAGQRGPPVAALPGGRTYPLHLRIASAEREGKTSMNTIRIIACCLAAAFADRGRLRFRTQQAGRRRSHCPGGGDWQPWWHPAPAVTDALRPVVERAMWSGRVAVVTGDGVCALLSKDELRLDKLGGTRAGNESVVRRNTKRLNAALVMPLVDKLDTWAAVAKAANELRGMSAWRNASSWSWTTVWRTAASSTSPSSVP